MRMMLTFREDSIIFFAWMPAFTKATKISYSIVYVAAGAVLFATAGNYLPLPDLDTISNG